MGRGSAQPLYRNLPVHLPEMTQSFPWPPGHTAPHISPVHISLPPAMLQLLSRSTETAGRVLQCLFTPLDGAEGSKDLGHPRTGNQPRLGLANTQGRWGWRLVNRLYYVRCEPRRRSPGSPWEPTYTEVSKSSQSPGIGRARGPVLVILASSSQKSVEGADQKVQKPKAGKAGQGASAGL